MKANHLQLKLLQSQTLSLKSAIRPKFGRHLHKTRAFDRVISSIYSLLDTLKIVLTCIFDPHILQYRSYIGKSDNPSRTMIRYANKNNKSNNDFFYSDKYKVRVKNTKVFPNGLDNSNQT